MSINHCYPLLLNDFWIRIHIQPYVHIHSGINRNRQLLTENKGQVDEFLWMLKLIFNISIVRREKKKHNEIEC